MPASDAQPSETANTSDSVADIVEKDTASVNT